MAEPMLASPYNLPGHLSLNTHSVVEKCGARVSTYLSPGVLICKTGPLPRATSYCQIKRFATLETKPVKYSAHMLSVSEVTVMARKVFPNLNNGQRKAELWGIYMTSNLAEFKFCGFGGM